MSNCFLNDFLYNNIRAWSTDLFWGCWVRRDGYSMAVSASFPFPCTSTPRWPLEMHCSSWDGHLLTHTDVTNNHNCQVTYSGHNHFLAGSHNQSDLFFFCCSTKFVRLFFFLIQIMYEQVVWTGIHFSWHLYECFANKHSPLLRSSFIFVWSQWETSRQHTLIFSNAPLLRHKYYEMITISVACIGFFESGHTCLSRDNFSDYGWEPITKTRTNTGAATIFSIVSRIFQYSSMNKNRYD